MTERPDHARYQPTKRPSRNHQQPLHPNHWHSPLRLEQQTFPAGLPLDQRTLPNKDCRAQAPHHKHRPLLHPYQRTQTLAHMTECRSLLIPSTQQETYKSTTSHQETSVTQARFAPRSNAKPSTLRLNLSRDFTKSLNDYPSYLHTSVLHIVRIYLDMTEQTGVLRL